MEQRKLYVTVCFSYFLNSAFQSEFEKCVCGLRIFQLLLEMY